MTAVRRPVPPHRQVRTSASQPHAYRDSCRSGTSRWPPRWQGWEPSGLQAPPPYRARGAPPGHRHTAAWPARRATRLRTAPQPVVVVETKKLRPAPQKPDARSSTHRKRESREPSPEESRSIASAVSGSGLSSRCNFEFKSL
eukprot:scaffold7374_cov112-Isochrysis_galbana.AAC.7